MAERAMVTAESLAAELDELIAKAVALGQPGVAVSAVMGKAKLFGFLVQKKETRAGPLDDLDFEQLRILDDVLNSIKGETTGATIASSEQPLPAAPGENVR